LKISIICGTEGRPEFMPWLAHTYNSLKTPPGYTKELVVVDSTPTDSSFDALTPLIPFRELVWVKHAPAGCTIAEKSNVGMDTATGEIIGWLDDDDGKAPCWLQWATSHLGDKDVLATHLKFPFFNLAMDPIKICYVPTFMWSLGLYRKAAVEKIRFMEKLSNGRPNVTGQDTQWQGWVWQNVPQDRQVFQKQQGLGFALSHEKNIANHRAKRKPFKWKYEIGNPGMWTEEEWGETMAQIFMLKESIYGQGEG